MAIDWDERWRELMSGAYQMAFRTPGHSAGQAENYNRLVREAEKIILAERQADAARRAGEFDGPGWVSCVDLDFQPDVDAEVLMNPPKDKLPHFGDIE